MRKRIPHLTLTILTMLEQRMKQIDFLRVF